MSRELDGRLSGWQRFVLKTHLLVCSGCAIARKQFQWLQKVAGLAGTEPGAAEQMFADDKTALPPDAAARIKETIQRARR